MPVKEVNGTLWLLPTFGTRLRCLVTALTMAIATGMCVLIAQTKGAEMIARTDVQPGTFEHNLQLGAYALWGMVVIYGLVTLWSLWIATSSSRRMTVAVGQQAVIWRPRLGFARRVPVDAITSVEDGDVEARSGYLRICYGTDDQRVLDIPKRLFLPPDLKQLRQRLDPGSESRVAAAAVASAAEAAAEDA